MFHLLLQLFVDTPDDVSEFYVHSLLVMALEKATLLIFEGRTLAIESPMQQFKDLEVPAEGSL